MKNNEPPKKTYRIYLKSTKEWIEVSEKVYSEYTKSCDSFLKKAQFHGRCVCTKNKHYLCDCNCYECEFQRAGDMLSLSAENENDNDDSCSLMDSVIGEDPLLEEIVCDKVTLEQLLKRLQELMPEAIEIARLRISGLTDEAIANIVGIKRTTFRSRLKKVKTILSAEFPEFF